VRQQSCGWSPISPDSFRYSGRRARSPGSNIRSIPWVGVIAAGYAFGAVYALDRERRVRVLLQTGVLLIVAFIAIRAIDNYGDPSRWSTQSSVVFTLLSFVNTTKYPPSLLYLLMTLGPACLALAWFEASPPGGWSRPAGGLWPRAVVLLSAPVAARPWGWNPRDCRCRKSFDYLFLSPPAIFSTVPPGAGFRLWVVYSVLGRHHPGRVSALPLVRGREAAPPRSVVKLFVRDHLNPPNPRSRL
jgi:hypothetical protein